MGDNSIKNSPFKILKPHAHLHIAERKSTKLQMNPIKDVGGVAETKSLGRTDGWMDSRMDGITHIRKGEGHFYSPPPPMSGDEKEVGKFSGTDSIQSQISSKTSQGKKDSTK